jgi:hypothetical protein
MMTSLKQEALTLIVVRHEMDTSRTQSQSRSFRAEQDMSLMFPTVSGRAIIINHVRLRPYALLHANNMTTIL